MDVRRINDELSVGEQITARDVAALRDAGFRAIICNRPDGEQPEQALFKEIEAAAQAVGLETRYQPVISGMVSEKDAWEFEQVMREIPAPVFAYCRSGMRSVVLWALTRAGRTPSSEILAAVRAAGFDPSGIEQRIAHLE